MPFIRPNSYGKLQCTVDDWEYMTVERVSGEVELTLGNHTIRVTVKDLEALLTWLNEFK